MVKKLLIVGIFLFFIGIVGCILTYKSAMKATEVNETQTIDYENIDSIEINTVSIDVDVISTTEKQAGIQLQGKTKGKYNPKLSVKVDGTKLIVGLPDKDAGNSFFQFSPNFSPDTLILKIYVPEKLLNTITIDSVSADLYVENIQVNTLEFKSISGDFDGENVKLNKKGTFENVSGEVEIDELDGDIEINTQSGDISLSMADLDNPIQIESTSGDVEITTKGEPKDVTFKVESVSGNIDLYDTFKGSSIVGKGSTLVKIGTVSGDISVETY